MASTYVVVKCQGLVHHSKDPNGIKSGGCGKIYTTHRKAFHKQLNVCPSCGSNKAQWEGPTRRRPPPPTIEPPAQPPPKPKKPRKPKKPPEDYIK